MGEKNLLKLILIVVISLLTIGCSTINKVEIGDENKTCEQLRAEIGITNDKRTDDNTKAVLGIGTAAAAAVALPVMGIGAFLAAPILIPAAAIASVAGVTYGSVKGYNSYQNKERIQYLTNLYNKKGCASATYASASATPTVAPTSPTVKKVIRDEELRQIQKSLSEKGYEPGVADGIFGKKTKAALEKFQEENGLVVTGKVDAATKGLLLDITVGTELKTETNSQDSTKNKNNSQGEEI